MENAIACLLTADEYAVIRFLREARGHGYRAIERELCGFLVAFFNGGRPEPVIPEVVIPEVVIPEAVPEVAVLYEVIDLTDNADMPDLAGLIGKWYVGH